MTDIVIGKEELFAKFQALTEEMQGRSLIAAALAGATVIVNAAKNNIKDEGLIRTRNLSRSIHSEVGASSPTMASVDVGTNVEYAAIHEFGGTITAKKSKYLAIPVGTYTGSPRDHEDLKPRKSANGWVLLDASGAIQYVLKTSVQIPAQPYLRPAMDEHQDQAVNAMASAFKQAINKAVENV
ncbi:MAG: HK97 gp10 family phage protein [Chloroflexi bacterium]|nr:HK97 gp10 family phage protein [Chloroflexota bacterium]